jgi:hypothetical protein
VRLAHLAKQGFAPLERAASSMRGRAIAKHLI